MDNAGKRYSDLRNNSAKVPQLWDNDLKNYIYTKEETGKVELLDVLFSLRNEVGKLRREVNEIKFMAPEGLIKKE